MKLKPIVVAALLVCAAPLASAGLMADMTQMFMSNSTAPGTLSTQDRVGAFGGSFQARTQTQHVNLVSFDPPRFDAGCGGIDLYGGSFSFINSQQLVQIFRQIAANAVGLAFKAAINAISPSLGNLMSEFQTLLQRMNNLGKNTCAIAGAIDNSAESTLFGSVAGSPSTAGTTSGMFSDASSALSSYLVDANRYLARVGSVNTKAGNTNVKAIQASGASALMGAAGLANADGSADNPGDPNSLNNRLLVSVMGYEVNGLPCQNQNAAGVADTSAAAAAAAAGSTIGTVACTGSPTVTLQDLITGGGTGSMNPTVPLKLYSCVNPNGTPGGLDPQICTVMRADDYNYVGIRASINTAIFGQADPYAGVVPTSIVGKFNSNASFTLSTQQAQLVHQAGVPLVQLLGKTSNPATRIQLALMLSEHVVSCIAAEVGQALYKGAVSTQNGGENNLSEDTKKNLALLRADFVKQLDVCQSDHKVLDAIKGINESLKLSATNNK